MYGPTEDGSPGATSERVVVGAAIRRGALATLSLLVLTSAAQAIVDHNVTDFRDTGWVYPFFVAVLVSYAVGGWIAGREAPDGALTNGALAGVLGFAAWIPIRILIWVVRDEHKGLFTGHEPVLRPGQLFGHVLIASALGMLGGFLGAGEVRRRSRPTPR
jgi:hypothetical protein